jgi:hypothetical protein
MMSAKLRTARRGSPQSRTAVLSVPQFGEKMLLACAGNTGGPVDRIHLNQPHVAAAAVLPAMAERVARAYAGISLRATKNALVMLVESLRDTDRA